MIKIKDGVDLAGISSELVLALVVADAVYTKVVGKDLTLTSVRDSKHRAGSKHYVGLAADLRTAAAGIALPAAIKIRDELKAALGAQFDVVVEGDHIHLELDPKVGAL